MGKQNDLSRSWPKINRAALTPIADLDPTNFVTARSLQAASEALQSLVRFDANYDDYPPATSSLMFWAEAVFSSQIEGLVVPAARLAEIQLGVPGQSNTRRVYANIVALKDVVEEDSFLDGCVLHRANMTLTGSALQDQVAKFRTGLVWVGGEDLVRRKTSFLGIDSPAISAAMADLQRFLDFSSADVLLKTAVGLAQFEAILPFEDGNGRTGRLLPQLTLHAQGAFQSSPAPLPLPLSEGLLRAGSGYFDALDKYRHGDLDPIVRVLARAVEDAVSFSLRAVAKVEQLNVDWCRRINARSDSIVWKVLEVLITQPIVSIPYLADTLRVSKPAAMRAIQLLATAEILQSSFRNRQQKLWQAPEAVDLLNSLVTDPYTPSFPHPIRLNPNL